MAKKTYLARNTIHITEEPGKAATAKSAAVPPKVAIIPANGKLTIDSDSDTCKELVKAGAIVLAPEAKDGKVTDVSVKKAPAKKAPAKKAPEPAADEAGDDDGEEMV
jgi:hypothetical protein